MNREYSPEMRDRALRMLAETRPSHPTMMRAARHVAAMVYTNRIVELGAVPSTGTVGDSFDNAMAEAVNNLYKTETAYYADLESANPAPAGQASP
jgi:transposase InsO family protein